MRKENIGPLNTYMVTLKGGYGSKTVQARSHSGAKYAAYLDYDVTGGLGFLEYVKWVESVHLLHKFRPSDLFGDPETFERMKTSRSLPFAHIGQEVVLHSSSRGDLRGIICGANHAHNLYVLFTGCTQTENCHPYYMLDYLDSNGQIIASFGA